MIDCKNEVHFYDLAKQAKDRLRKNNYNAITKQKVVNNSRAFSDYIVHKREIACNRHVDEKPKSADDEMYQKVCRIIENNNIVNPILELIDKEFFDTLDCESKQVYINNLTQKYKFMKTRYFRENYSKINSSF